MNGDYPEGEQVDNFFVPIDPMDLFDTCDGCQ